MNPDTVAQDLLSTAEDYGRMAKGKADHWEVFVSSSRSLSVGLQGGLVSADDGLSQGVGVRVAKGKRLGFASSSGLSRDSFASALEEAITIARAVGFEDKNFEGFTDAKGFSKEGELDPRLATLQGEEIVEQVGTLYREAKGVDERITAVESQVGVGFGAYAVVNSSGIATATRQSGMVGSAYVMAAVGDRRKTGSDFLLARGQIDLGGLGARAARGAVDMLSAKPLGRTLTVPTVWEPRTAASFFEVCLENSVNGRSVLEGRSAFRDKLGERVASPNLSILDDGQYPEGMATAATDAEGVPQRQTPILKKGNLKSFLYDTYFGRMAGRGSTGNGSRGGTEPFATVPHIGSTTLVVEPGRGTQEDLISQIDEGLLITDSLMGLGHANLISGDFSAVATNAYLIQDCQVAGSLEPVSLAGNLYRALGQVSRLGEDRRIIGGVVTPTVVIEGLTATG